MRDASTSHYRWYLGKPSGWDDAVSVEVNP